jgi:L-alanine-DL-glutamate epimerase-like enolase superfamily enzyme
MIVKKVDIWHLKLPFFYPFKHKLATHEGSENLVVKVTTDAGLTGYGEGVPRVFVTGETLSSATSFLAETLVPAVLEAAFPYHVGFLETLAGIFRQVHAEGFPAACCALEMSLLDAAGGTWQMPLSDFLGGGLKESVHYSAVLPLAAPGQLARFFQLVKTRKMKFLKLKVGGADDLAVLEMTPFRISWLFLVRFSVRMKLYAIPRVNLLIFKSLPTVKICRSLSGTWGSKVSSGTGVRS